MTVAKLVGHAAVSRGTTAKGYHWPLSPLMAATQSEQMHITR